MVIYRLFCFVRLH